MRKKLKNTRIPDPKIQHCGIVLAVANPVGSDYDHFFGSIETNLKAHGYTVHAVRLIDLLGALENTPPKISHDKYLNGLIQRGNDFRKEHGNDALAKLAIGRVAQIRSALATNDGRNAFVLRSLKRPEEVELLRAVYRTRFVLCSLYSSYERRLTKLSREIATSITEVPNEKHEAPAQELIRTDEAQGNKNGQRLLDTFAMGDVFINLDNAPEIDAKVRRFVNLLHCHPSTTPTREEFGMFCAAGAALRSSDLSRQVGAAIMTPHGDVVALGCNEVPKAGGGQYWEGDSGDARDFALGYDSNEIARKQLFLDVLGKLKESKWITPEQCSKSMEDLFVEALGDTNLRRAKIFEITEYGRAVHAEMAALTNAAMRGISVGGCTLFTTTYPCHNCAKHIVASGISKVIYVQPYPKSYAMRLHKDAIAHDGLPAATPKVSFESFEGISPDRYLSLFRFGKGERKDSGKARMHSRHRATPRGSADQVNNAIAHAFPESLEASLREWIAVDTWKPFLAKSLPNNAIPSQE